MLPGVQVSRNTYLLISPFAPKDPDFEFLQTAKSIFKAVVPVPDEELVLHQLQSPNPEQEDS